MAEVTIKIVSSFCNRCMQETEHDVIHSEVSDCDFPDGAAETYKTIYLSCRGCKEPAIRKERWYFDYISDLDRDPSENLREATYIPPRIWRRPPMWLAELEKVDSDLKGLLDEIYSVANDQQTRLLSMGVRAALDHVMTKILGRDVGGFEKKLDEMVGQGHLTARQKENIAIVVDAGSASSHRGYRPPRQLVEEMVSVTENIIREHYVTGPMLKHAKTKIPPRPRSP